MVSGFGVGIVVVTGMIRYSLCSKTQDGARELTDLMLAVGLALIVLGFLVAP